MDFQPWMVPYGAVRWISIITEYGFPALVPYGTTVREFPPSQFTDFQPRMVPYGTVRDRFWISIITVYWFPAVDGTVRYRTLPFLNFYQHGLWISSPEWCHTVPYGAVLEFPSLQFADFQTWMVPYGTVQYRFWISTSTVYGFPAVDVTVRYCTVLFLNFYLHGLWISSRGWYHTLNFHHHSLWISSHKRYTV
jgi:hypothetical protein